MRTILGLILLLASGAAAEAQTVTEIDRRDAAVYEAWAATPLGIRKAVFVSEHPGGFGQFVERPDNAFKIGEKLVAYVEPIGYGWKEIGGGQYEFGFDVDFLLKKPKGDVLTGKQDFARLIEKSHARNREFMVALTMNVTGAEPGDYVLQYTLRDITGPKTVSFDLPFKIVK